MEWVCFIDGRKQKLILGVIVAMLFVFLTLTILLVVSQSPVKQNNYYVQSNNVNSIVASQVNTGAVQERIIKEETKPKEYLIIHSKKPTVTTKTKQCSYVKTPYTTQEKQLVAGEPCGIGMKYSSSKREETSKGVLGGEINEYIVNVRNNDCKAGYFIVKFYLSSACGEEKIASVKHYLDPNEVESFVYQSREEYSSWKYSVIPDTKSVTQEIKLRTVTKYRYDWVCSWKQ